jgi:phosphohistidine phosphatase SixA
LFPWNQEQVLAAVSAAAAAACHTVMCVGHNRGWEEAASELSGQDVELKTANACVLEARPGDGWGDALAQAGPAWALRGILTPG